MKRYVYLNHRFKVHATICPVNGDITVWVEDGTVTATMHGEVPDGEYVITLWDAPSGKAAALSSCAPGA